ncbi:CCA tRNA nucleotidyltransferase, mitochondrial [Gryganskiella cystojenkinii]|nr:CCA tRNA nucleotidyltransferase, mitochondrial [Gryganskiella cystojenkinii]
MGKSIQTSAGEQRKNAAPQEVAATIAKIPSQDIPLESAGLKRKASSDLSPAGPDEANKQPRVLPVSYGTSVFFRRPVVNQGQVQEVSSSQGPRPMVIQLTDQEAKICEVLDQVARKYEAKEGKKVQLRIAGGWVRDKLLGLSCHDLDIGLDTMMGFEFATLVNDHMQSLGHQKRTIAKIATNPEKSKHLETATMVVLGMPLDFVNLRSEVYDDESRIPTEITFGTPSEDAERRDITINALFYNIHTHTVEDFTGKGLEDLRNGLVRTPLEPYTTFSQDPLRVMRCIRFASRFHFAISDETKQAILDPRIKQVLKTKISKERIGAELDKMIDDGAGRSTAIRLLNELGLYDVVFAPPETDRTTKGTTVVEGEIGEIDEAFKLVWILEWILKIHPNVDSGAVVKDSECNNTEYEPEADAEQESLLQQVRASPELVSHLYPVVRTQPSAPSHIPQIIPKDTEQDPVKLGQRNLILAGMLYPYRAMTAKVNKKFMPAGSWILRFGLKGRNLDIEIVTKLVESLKNVQRVVDLVSSKPKSGDPAGEEAIRQERAEMGMVIRDIGFIIVVGKKWPCAFILALAAELLPKFEQLKQGIFDEDVQTAIAKYNSFLSKAEVYKIEHCFTWKYLVDGKELTKLLQVRAGPKITDYLQIIMRWQLRNPESSKEECQQWVLSHKDQFP